MGSSSDVIKSVVFVVVFVATAVVCAPVIMQEKGDAQKIPALEIENQERDLENLINLAHNQASQKNVHVSKTHQTSMESHNGELVKTEQTEEKAVSMDDGRVIADVKQEVKQATSGQDGKPEAVVETEVDIPSAGVHKTFVQEAEPADTPTTNTDATDNNDDEIALPADVVQEAVDDKINDEAMEAMKEGDVEEEAVPLTTQDMAEYLFVTQQFDEFLPALERLVMMSKMTASDAASYAKAVIEDYEKLDTELFSSNAFVSEKRVPMPYYQPQEQPMVPEFPSIAQPMPAKDYLYGYQAYLTPQEQYLIQQQQQQQQLQQQQYFPQEPQVPISPDQAVDPLDFLTTLYDAAYRRENPEAQEIIQMLYDRVSMDNNPDDLGQIRDLLMDTVSASMYGNNFPSMSAFDQGAELMPQGEEEDSLISSAPSSSASNFAPALLNDAENKMLYENSNIGDVMEIGANKGLEVKRSDEIVEASTTEEGKDDDKEEDKQDDKVDDKEKESKDKAEEDLEGELSNMSQEKRKPETA